MTHGVPRPVRIVAQAIGVLVVIAGFGVGILWLATQPRAQDRAVREARTAGNPLAAKVMHLADGERIDLATAVGRPWERAVLIPAYADSDDMNKIVGFSWWPPGYMSGSDESQHMLAFIAGDTVVAEMEVSPDTFLLSDPALDTEDSDVAFVPFNVSDAVFVASRAPGGIVTLAKQ